MDARAFLVEIPEEVEQRLRPVLDRRGVETVAFRPVGFFSLCMRSGCRCGPTQRCADMIVYGCDFSTCGAFDTLEKQFSRHCRVSAVAIVSSNWTAPALSHVVSLGIQSFASPVHLGKFDAWVSDCLQDIPDGRMLADWFRGTMSPDELRNHLHKPESTSAHRRNSRASEATQSDPE